MFSPLHEQNNKALIYRLFNIHVSILSMILTYLHIKYAPNHMPLLYQTLANSTKNFWDLYPNGFFLSSI